MQATERERDHIRIYAENQSHEEIVHLEKVGSEVVGLNRHDIWDVHCPKSRWWVVTNMTNLYNQTDFKSRDVVLTFHVGLMARIMHRQSRTPDIAPDPAALLAGSWRRWEQAAEAYDGVEEAETYQAVGMRLRECLVSFLEETCGPSLVPAGGKVPVDGDFRGWTALLANALAGGGSAAKLRSYLKKNAAEVWEYVNWLTHYKNALRMDAEIGLKVVEHLLGMFTAARLRLGQRIQRCEECSSYRVRTGVCEYCGWEDPDYEMPEIPEESVEDRERRLAQPCTLTSDISTFVSPGDFDNRGMRNDLG